MKEMCNDYSKLQTEVQRLSNNSITN